MKEIVLRGRKIVVEKVIGYGCSFTAGDELCDHIIHPDADQIKATRGIMYWKDRYGTLENRQKFKTISKEHELSWVGQLASNLNVPFENNAIGGYSLDSAIFRLEQDFYNHKITSNTLAVLGITNPWRVMYFNRGKQEIKNVLLSHITNSLDKGTILNIYSNDLLMLNYVNSIQRLIAFAKDYNINLYAVPMVNTIEKQVEVFLKEDDHVYLEALPLIKTKADLISKSPFVENRSTLYSYCENSSEDQHGGNHPKKHVHKKLADYLTNKLTKN